MNDLKVPELLLPGDYIKLATTLAKKAQKRIYLVSLNVNRCNETNELINAIISAANRGVDVHVGADLLTFICDRNAKITSRLAGREMLQTSRMRSEFIKSGATFHWLGADKVPYFLGRTHSKWTVIDDDVFAFGGVNLSQASIAERADYMFHVKSSKIADRLASEQIMIENPNALGYRTKNSTVKTPIGEIIIDSGRLGKSSIYRQALSIAKQASELLVVSQYCPTGKLGKIIRQKPTRLYFNPKGSADDIVNNIMIGSKNTTSSQNNLYKRNRYIHAKFIVATMPDGTKQAITGSHNFAVISGRAGTREIALKTNNSCIIDQLEKFCKDQIS